jgi:hypothetical protein
MDHAVFVKVIAPRVGDHVRLLVVRTARANVPLPLHQLKAELPGKRTGNQMPARPEALPQAWKKHSDFFRRGKTISRNGGLGDG